jgi:hypothetical protein
VNVTFEEVNPCSGKDYMYHPTIKTVLETSLDLHISDKRKRVDYRGSSPNVSEPNLPKLENSEIAKFEWEAVHTGKGKSYRSHPIVQQFLEGSDLTAPAVGKRLCVDLAGPSGLAAEG